MAERYRATSKLLMGDSGSGKTALGRAPLLAQLISLQDSAVVVIDLKGDMPLFQTAQNGADKRFKFFTNEVGKATHAFNPFGPFSSDHISLNQVCEVF
ncbi:MAG: ATP-binding protein [Candidatus Competibacteraceae bacterium]|nr:ATP-binding protein [Candidatus Competibacteraceae bacterium]